MQQIRNRLTTFITWLVRDDVTRILGSLIVVILIVILVAVLALRFQTETEIEQSRFARHDTTRSVSGTSAELHISYPVEVRTEPQGEAGRALTLWLVDTQAMTHTATYTVALRHRGQLVFTDAQGQPVLPEVVLTVQRTLSPQVRLFVSSLPLVETEPTTTLDLVVQAEDVAQPEELAPLTLALESRQAAWWRLFRVRLLGDTALLLSLIGVLGTVISIFLNFRKQLVEEERARQKREVEEERVRIEQEAAELRRRVQTVREAIRANPLRGVALALDLEHDARPGAQQDLLRQEWPDVRYTVDTQQLMQQVNAELQASTATPDYIEQHTSRLLRDVARFFDGERLGERMHSLHTLLSEPELPTLSLEQIQQAIQAAFWFWREYGDDIDELVIRSLVRVSRWQRDEHSGEAELFAAFQTFDNRRDLLRYPRLKHIAPRFEEAFSYTLPTLWQRPPPAESDRMQSWLELQPAFQRHPFRLGMFEQDSPLLTSWVPPEQWGVVSGPEPALVVGSVPDRAAAAVMLRHELRPGEMVPQPNPAVFAVWVPVPSVLQWAGYAWDDWLRSFAHTVASMWIDILSDAPDVLLDLDVLDQVQLVSLLAWSRGSVRALLLWLEQTRLQDDAQGRKFLRQMHEVFGPQPQIEEPRHATLLHWVRLRPPLLPYTYLLLDLQISDAAAQLSSHLDSLLHLMAYLSGTDVFVKLFAPPLPDVMLPVGVAQVPLRWNDTSLRAMLRARLGFTDFGMLFGPALPDADQRLLDCAAGSLGKLLELGYAILERHIQRDSNPDQFLYAEDLEHVLRQSNTGV